MPAYIAALIGGPIDGQIWAMPTLPPTIRYPITPTLTSLFNAALTPHQIETHYMTYELILDPAMGKPSINDRGEHRYKYIGDR